MKTPLWARLGAPFFLFLAVSSFAPSASAALEFTLQHRPTIADAIAVDEVYISDGSSKIFLHVPGGWQVNDSPVGIDLFPGINGAQARLEAYPGGKLLTSDQAGANELVALATGQIPKEAKKIETASVDLNPLPIFGWHTMEIVLRYEILGQRMRRSMLYANMMLPGRVVRLTVVAPDADFDKVHKQARQFLASWFEPSRDLPPDLRRKYEDPKGE